MKEGGTKFFHALVYYGQKRESVLTLKPCLGNKRNEISKEDRREITKLYADFQENELSKIYSNTEFIYREYAVMQPLQRSYSITEKRIENLISKGALSSLYDEAKVDELESKGELTGKEKNKLEAFYENKPLFDNIIALLKRNVSDEVYFNPKQFIPVIESIMRELFSDSKELKKIVEKIVKGLSLMDKQAEIHRDKKGNIIYDTDTKDVELVPWKTDIDEYMATEVLPHIPDAKAFFEEDLGKAKPVIKTGAEIPFTRYFYKYQAPTPSDKLVQKFIDIDASVNLRVKDLFGGK